MPTQLPTAPILASAVDLFTSTAFTTPAQGDLRLADESGRYISPTYALVDGLLVQPGESVTLASGARVTIGADLSYTYDPGDNFAGLAPGASATDSFTYSLVSGGVHLSDLETSRLGIGDIVPIGDVNGDGLNDLYSPGANRFIYGDTEWPVNLSVAEIQAVYDDGYTSNQTVPTDYRGDEVVTEAAVGDVNGDGIDDFAVISEEHLTVLYGREGGFGGIVDLDDLDPSEGFVVVLDRPDQTGFGVAAAGDVNGDGLADIALTTQWPAFQFNEEEYETFDNFFIYGNAGPIASPILITELTASADSAGTHFGVDSDVVAVGDVDGDGFDDVAGRRTEDTFYGGFSYGYYTMTFGAEDLALNGPSATVGYVYDYQDDDFSYFGDPDYLEYIGRSNLPNPFGDFNGDGIDDTGFSSDRNGLDIVSVVYGGGGDDRLTIYGTPDGAGQSVRGAGEVNGDSFDDFLIADDGETYVLFGGNSFDSDPAYVISDEATVTIELARYDGLDLTVTTGVPLSGGTGSDVLRGSAADDTLTGLGGRDSLLGEDGRDRLDGGAGADTMVGGAGNDYYIVGHKSDEVSERVGDGNDTVLSYANDYVLDENVEVVKLGEGRMTATGNAGDNRVVGNAEANSLYGMDGNDRIHGLGGDDRIDGGDGDDTMIGGRGDDLFYVSSVDDMIVEEAGGGTDTIIAYSRGRTDYPLFAMSANVETFILRGNRRREVTGNDLDNTITADGSSGTLSGMAGDDTVTGGAAGDRLHGGDGDDSLLGNNGRDTLYGNSGDDTLNGGAGSDTMRGGSGDDLYIVGVSDDVVEELAGEGRDMVRSYVGTYALGDNVEDLDLGSGSTAGTGNALANLITGNDGDNVLSGLGGRDTIVGGAGQDIITLGDARDVVVFGEGDSGPTADTRDIVADFASGKDRLDLCSIDADTTTAGNQAFHYVGTGALTQAGDIGYRIYGDRAVIVADTDGNGGADLTIELTGLAVMSNTDFIL